MLLVCCSVVTGLALSSVALVVELRTRVEFVLLWPRFMAVAARVMFRVAGLLFGGVWHDSSKAGSRSRLSDSTNVRFRVTSGIGGRGASSS